MGGGGEVTGTRFWADVGWRSSGSQLAGMQVLGPVQTQAWTKAGAQNTVQIRIGVPGLVEAEQCELQRKAQAQLKHLQQVTGTKTSTKRDEGAK